MAGLELGCEGKCGVVEGAGDRSGGLCGEAVLPQGSGALFSMVVLSLFPTQRKGPRVSPTGSDLPLWLEAGSAESLGGEGSPRPASHPGPDAHRGFPRPPLSTKGWRQHLKRGVPAGLGETGTFPEAGTGAPAVKAVAEEVRAGGRGPGSGAGEGPEEGEGMAGLGLHHLLK